MASNLTDHEVPRVLPPELHPDVSQLVTEDDTPVDNIFSEKQQRLLTEPLYSSSQDAAAGRPFVALSNVGLFYSIHQPPYVPDMLLSLDVTVPANLFPKSHRSYFVWEYGKPPDIVVEVVSNREGGEATDKFVGYARIGVTYYVIFDPEHWLSNDSLRAFERQGTTYHPLFDPVWFRHVGLGLRLWQGSYEGHENTWIRWVDASSQLILSGAERAERERDRAERERDRADQERDRANQERDRANKLIEQLRRLGVEPEA